jgi:predicted 3-demethylubiquinone-9 3-methyltransferase (glyoxalase superfamily)
MSIEQQLAMNFYVGRRPLPINVIDIIKSFAFQDKTIAFIKAKKREIIEQFYYAIYSRKNQCAWVTDTSETWLFMFSYQFVPMQSGNCSICGEYFFSNNPRTICRCNI